MQAVVFGDAHHGDVQLTPDARSMIYSVHSASHPVEIYRGFSSGGPPIQLTHLNDDVMEAYESGEVEEITYESIDGTSISGFLVQPPNFDFERKYPLLLLIHGGPQGAWGEAWSYRWNPQVLASAGYLVFMPNPRGSTGYGQALTDAINGDWGGLVYEDIMAGVDYVLRRPYVDSNKLVAAGGSFGGYMINWMLGRTTRFRAFVSHAGVLRSAQHVRFDRRVVLPDLGVRRHALGEPGVVRTLVAQPFRHEVSDADVGDPWGERLPRAVYAEHAVVHGRFNCARCRRSSCISRTRGIGFSSRATASTGTRP